MKRSPIVNDLHTIFLPCNLVSFISTLSVDFYKVTVLIEFTKERFLFLYFD